MKALGAQTKDRFLHENNGLYSIKLKNSSNIINVTLNRPNHVIERVGEMVYLHHNDEATMIATWVALNAVPGNQVCYGLGDGIFPFYVGIHKDNVENISFKG